MPESRTPPPHVPSFVGFDAVANDDIWFPPQALYEVLSPWRGRKAYIVPIADKSGRTFGNNGDELMMKVFRHILDRFEMRVVEEIRAADVLIVPPNGALLQMYSFPDLMQMYSAENQQVPMIIFPSSAQFPTRDPSFMFRGRRARTTWILREQYSYKHLKDLWGESLAAVNCELLLDHDVVASHSKFVRGLFNSVNSGRPLVGARKDVEQNTARPKGEAETEQFATQVMSALRSTVVRRAALAIPYGRVYTRLARTARAKLQKEAGAQLIARLPDGVQSRFRVEGVIHCDVSSKHQATFDEYLRTIASAGPVVTDRLHIALPATILGKEVWLVEGGYHKARGVVERSMYNASNLHLVVPAHTAE